ncbi:MULTISPECIES: hypothetical protein [Streptomyces]|uniref:hypothetical protein n=1 Tax=Streptomyces TaxID=1883 RepID=UPI0034388121
MAGVLWKSPAGTWCAAGSSQVTSITATGGVPGQVAGRLLAAPAKAGDRTELTGQLANGNQIKGLG